MDSINISQNGVTLAIDNDENRTITFYPQDVAFVEGLYSLAEEFSAMQQTVRGRMEVAKKNHTGYDLAKVQLKLVNEVFDFIFEKIDEIFGDGTAFTVFGNTRNLNMITAFFNGLMPYVEKKRNEATSKYLSQNNGVLE